MNKQARPSLGMTESSFDERYSLKTVDINPFLIVRWLPLLRLASILPSPTTNPAIATNHAKLLHFLCRLEQLLLPGHWSPIKQQQQPANEDPPTFRPTEPQRHPNREPQYRHACSFPTLINIARHDAAANLPASLAVVKSQIRNSALRF